MTVNTTTEWLPHLTNAIPQEAYGYKICTYTVALEGWRRGLELFFYSSFINGKLNLRYSLSNGKKTHHFSATRGDLTTKGAVKICINKNLTKEFLSDAGVSVPLGDNFDETATDDQIVEVAKKIGFPLVVKPSDGSAGKGVVANIQNEQELREALVYVRKNLKLPAVMLEQFVKGEDFRIYVIEDRVLGAVTRIPANVIGDGKSTIKELVEAKNINRDKNPYMFNKPIRLNNEAKKLLTALNLNFNSVLEEGRRIFLAEKSNVSAGGDPVDITNTLTPEIKEMAIGALNAIPGLVQGAVDMVVNKETNNGVVLEINSKAEVSLHTFPAEGEPRDLPSDIIDYYFPETKNMVNIRNTKLFFDFDSIIQPIEAGLFKEIKVPNVPKYKHKVRAIRVSGKVQNVGYRKWVMKKAISLKLNGYAKNLKNGDVLVVVSGPSDNLEKMRKTLDKTSPKDATVKNVTEKSYSKPIKIGFTII
ncbi:Cyanophycin synthetase [Sutcliffiella horikoshii]|uniref:acylphosphatase n=1 Tax=Sutcliffiella horikoshii TaxID=79883 RepID=A0ABN4ZHY2_9BACI|nr:acylphosphatase [Sutcliffiella horikoshii]ART78083.1 Cyanophycin synthetase [Sutcliffiella horikoshii]